MSKNITLTNLAHALKLPGGPSTDDDDGYLERLESVRAAAQNLTVRSAEDAALALSLVCSHLNDLKEFVFSEEETAARASRASGILIRVLVWVMQQDDVKPLDYCLTPGHREILGMPDETEARA